MSWVNTLTTLLFGHSTEHRAHYKTKNTAETLTACAAIPLQTIQEVCHSVAHTYQHCNDTGGGYFKHLRHYGNQDNDGIIRHFTCWYTGK